MSVYTLVPWYHELIARDSNALATYLTGPFLAATHDLASTLARHRTISGPRYAPGPHPRAEDPGLTNDLWLLYGFSRVNDALLLLFQSTARAPGIARQEWATAYRHYWTALGFAPFGAGPYSPFYHEIVEVADPDPGQSVPRIEAVRWPGLMFGDLLFARAGVRVRFPAGAVNRRTAEESTLYFAYQRLHRRTNDLSMGWGHNSQWRTRFHRCYTGRGRFHFNVDGNLDLGGNDRHPNAGLPLAERRALLVNRCFVRATPQMEEEWWPWDDTLTVAHDTPLWRL
jgi:hypothetical protein